MAMQTEQRESLDCLIEELYRSVLDPEPWKSFVDAFHAALGAWTAGLIVRRSGSNDCGLMVVTGGPSTGWEEIYHDHYFAYNPFVNLPIGEPVSLREIVSDDDLIQSSIYADFMEPLGIFHAMAVKVTLDDGYEAGLSASRQRDAQPFGEDERELYQCLVPHLKQGLRIHARLTAVESERNVYASAVDQLSLGAIILDQRSMVLETNEPAKRLIDQGDTLGIRNGRIYAKNPKDTQTLQRLIDEALIARETSTPTLAGAMRADVSDTSARLGYLVRPLPPSEWSMGDRSPAVSIFITSSQSAPLASEAVLQEIFQLTPTEAKVATLLAAGLSLNEVSTQLQVSVHTAKTHLRRIFSKTSVSRQSELVRLILRSVATLAE